VTSTRPETLLGDTAIALHPEDPRRSRLEGKFAWHPFRSCPIPIIFDPFVDKSFGSGAVKITPAHNRTDWEVGKRHGLDSVQVFDESGTVIVNDFKGVDRFDARQLTLDALQNLGLLRDVQDHSMQLPVCSRSGDVVEVMLKPQWFLNCQSAAEKAIDAVKSGNLKLDPPNYERVWMNWLENIKDWNISRQLWWGHPIPTYQAECGENSKWIAAIDEAQARQKASHIFGVKEDEIKIEKDPDVLDTWFSSSLSPLYSLGWPKDSEEMKERFPFPLLETGHDIIFFWVARMVMMSILLTGMYVLLCLITMLASPGLIFYVLTGKG